MPGYSFRSAGSVCCQKSMGTSHAMSQRNPSMPRLSQKRMAAAIAARMSALP